MTYTVMSKRRFIELVNGGYVKGYDDPRLPTLAGLRRRGYTPEAIHEFCSRIGVAKTDSIVDVAVLEDCVREDLNKRSPRVMAVLNPLKVVITNYPEGQVEELDAVNNPEDPERRDAQGAVRARAVHRARGLPRGPAAEVLPPRARPRGAAALRLLHQVRGRGQGRERRDRRAALHLRSRDSRRRRARRPQGEGHAALGLREARRSPPRRGSTTTSSPSRTRTTSRRARTGSSTT